tara:strand:- start:222 stop:455 length:234 start_codon:yes stop_codon:yes gene_type:complete
MTKLFQAIDNLNDGTHKKIASHIVYNIALTTAHSLCDEFLFWPSYNSTLEYEHVATALKAMIESSPPSVFPIPLLKN